MADDGRSSDSAPVLLAALICLFAGHPVSLLAQTSGAPGTSDSALIVTTDYPLDGWVDARQPIGLRISRPLNSLTERLAVVIGRTDVTALFVILPSVARYSAHSIPLPAGETELTAYVVSADETWTEIGRFPLRVRTRGGFQKAELRPALTLSSSGRIAQEKSRGISGVAFNPAMRSVLERSDGAAELQANFLGVTHRQDALRFGPQGAAAPKFDLSDYLLRARNGPLSATVGHLAYGANKHLISGFASRGMSTGIALASFAELSLAALNGSSIVGWDNPVGLNDSRHRVYGASLKLEAIPQRPGAALLDVSWMNGSQLPVSGFNQNLVNDREQSRGWGVRFGGKSPDDRISLDAGFAMSRFANPVDATLSQGTPLVPVRAETKAARFADLSVAVIRDVSLWTNVKANLAATLRHERVDPLYRSLAAATQANALQNALELNGGVGPIAIQGSHARSEDNLDDLATVLKTFTHVSALHVGIPLGSVLRSSNPSSFLPQITYTLNRTRQFANELPSNGDFAESHVPDQVSVNHSVDAQWTMAKWRGGYRYNRSAQDNRQVGREQSDLRNLAHNLTADFSPTPRLDLGATLAFESADNKEFKQVTDTRRLGGNIGIRAGKDFAASVAIATTWMRDEPRTAESDDTALSAEFSQGFRLFGRREKPSGRVFLRCLWQTASNASLNGGVRSETAARRIWSLDSGVSLNAF